MKKSSYHGLCLMFSMVQTPIAIFILYCVIASFFTLSNGIGEIFATLIGAVIFNLPLAFIDCKLRKIESCVNIFVDLGASMLAAPVRFFLELATIAKLSGGDEEFGARGVFCKGKASHARYYAAWNRESDESRAERTHQQETAKQKGIAARAAADAEIEARARFLDGLKRSDNKQNLLILPVARYHYTSDADKFSPFSCNTYDKYNSFSMTEIYINGRRINAVPEITPITLSLKAGVYDIRVTAHYRTFADLNWKHDRTKYVGERDFDKTHTFEYKGLYIGENAPVRLVLAAQFAAKYRKEYYTVNGKPTGEKLWTFEGWDYKFYDAMTMTPEQIASVTIIPYVDARTYKVFDPRVNDIATIKRMAERY